MDLDQRLRGITVGASCYVVSWTVQLFFEQIHKRGKRKEKRNHRRTDRLTLPRLHSYCSFVTWLPTATAIRTTVDPRLASSSAAARISEELGAALSSMAADAGGQGGPSGKCIGDCPDKEGHAVGKVLSLGMMLATLGSVLGVLLVV